MNFQLQYNIKTTFTAGVPLEHWTDISRKAVSRQLETIGFRLHWYHSLRWLP